MTLSERNRQRKTKPLDLDHYRQTGHLSIVIYFKHFDTYYRFIIYSHQVYTSTSAVQNAVSSANTTGGGQKNKTLLQNFSLCIFFVAGKYIGILGISRMYIFRVWRNSGLCRIQRIPKNENQNYFSCIFFVAGNFPGILGISRLYIFRSRKLPGKCRFRIIGYLEIGLTEMRQEEDF